MGKVFDPASYELGLASIPYLVAAITFLIMSGHVALMRGAPLLRGSFIGMCGPVLLFLVTSALMMSTSDLQVARSLFRSGLSMASLAGGAALVFDLLLARKLAQHWMLAVAGVTVSMTATIICIATPLVVEDMWITPTGVPFGIPGPLAIPHILTIGACVFGGSFLLWQTLDGETAPLRRRQLTGTMWAFAICGLSVVDIALMYGLGWYPTSCFFLTVGGAMALRSLVADDLLRATEMDRRVPAGFAYFAVAGAAAWWIIDSRGNAIAVTVALLGVFIFLRTISSTYWLLSRPTASVTDTPLERAIDQFVDRVKQARTLEEVAGATEQVIGLALGAEKVLFLEPSSGDYSWRGSDGEVLTEAATPDPRLLTWFIDHSRPLSRDRVVAARLGDLREPLEHFFDIHEAEVIIPLMNRDATLGLVCVSALPGGRALRPEEHALLARIQGHATSAVVYATMYRETNERVAVAKELELAAAVQEAFVPPARTTKIGPLRITGSYAPASRCGGDWWSTHALKDGRIMVLIGDVTGHGVAAAMVTAAAKGCYDVALRLMGDGVDVISLLRLLDSAVRRAGGNDFYMTCFASLLDPKAGTITYANAGHVVPYVCRVAPSGETSLSVLVARGNPLGTSGEFVEYKSRVAPLHPGDLLVWYTDGIVECANQQGQQYGDRRFQRALKRLTALNLDVDAVRDHMIHDTLTFQEGQAPDDDITLVVGKLTSSNR